VVVDCGRLELKQHAITETAQLNQSVSMPKASSASTSCLLPVSGGGGDGCAVGAGHVDRRWRRQVFNLSSLPEGVHCCCSTDRLVDMLPPRVKIFSLFWEPPSPILDQDTKV
jgi:hypothetical protein